MKRERGGDVEMGTEAREPEWTIYARREVWPEAAGRVFLPDAVDRLSDAIWASDDVDLVPVRAAIDKLGGPEEQAGVLWTMVHLFSRLFVNGSLSTFVRPVGGERTQALRSHAWERDDATRAVSDGVIRLRAGAAVEPVDHWVFLDQVEFDLLMLIHSPAGGPPEDVLENLRRRHERFADIVMGNLAAIARSARTALPTRDGPGLGRTIRAGDPTPEELDEMFRGARRVLQAQHQIALEERAAEWLLARFGEDPDRELRKQHYREVANVAFDDYLVPDRFMNAWRLATVMLPERTKRGRPPKRNKSAKS